MTAYFGRRYKLSASHRLFCPEWDEARNYETFGKCANPYGHGHNYVVEVLTGGPVHAVTGMVVDLVELDAYVAREVLDPFDHANLNLAPAFKTRVPTSENFCIEIFDRLQKVLSVGLLRQVRVEETSNNAFTYTGALAAPGAVSGKR
jgi:6-pyruvoyltetrahydropterin/6-carboxytetrahydropterin synthase